MKQAPWKHKHFPFLQKLLEKVVSRVNKAGQYSAFADKEHLSGPWVGMWQH
uniref:Rhicadhesin receptor n=1 Tax=Rhizophora mucronata TaxID=61149 RepID=A0A2P2NHH3_RHIMU